MGPFRKIFFLRLITYIVSRSSHVIWRRSFGIRIIRKIMRIKNKLMLRTFRSRRIFKKNIIFVVITFHAFSNFINCIEMLLSFIILNSFYFFIVFTFLILFTILFLLFCLGLFHIFSIISIIKIVSLSWKNV